ncbi:hypothetical protein FRC00_000846 [Tulasnella sp. 408]|nr:hypothetical protein FRC00_000846 [Tulasnella sp. 408]
MGSELSSGVSTSAGGDANFKGLLEAMDLKLQWMTDFKTLFDDSVRREVVKHARHRNALRPVGTLPTELLQDIFSLLLFTAEGSRKRRFMPTLITLRAVSWSWRDLLEATPTFWTRISSEDDIRFVSEALEKSNHAPLHLTHIRKYQDLPETPFMEKVILHSHRWESVTLHQPNAELATKYCRILAPKMKAFLLSSMRGSISESGGLSSLFRGGLKDLEELRVADCGRVVWEGLNYTRLRVLEIRGENFLGMGIVLDILAANPNLEVIRLLRLTFVQCVQPQSSPAPLPLKNLKELTLKNITHITEDWDWGGDVPIAHILQWIQLRPSTVFTLVTELQHESSVKPEEFINLLPSPMEALAYLSRLDDFHSAKVYAKFSGRKIRLEIHEGSRSKPIFSIDVDGLPYHLVNNWVVGALGEARTIPMDLRLHFAGEEPTRSLDGVFSFQLWESVKELSLDGNFRSPLDVGRKFLQLLSTLCTSEEGTLVMPFPKLQNLYLSGLSGIKAKDMLKMVRVRFAAPAAPGATAHGTAPTPFTIHCGNGVGGWKNKCMDDILATAGVQGIKDYKDTASGSSSTSSESEWPPPYDYHANIEHLIGSEGSLYDSGAELSQQSSDAEVSLHDSDAEDGEDDI